MSEQLEQRILCPYCNEPIVLLVDPSIGHQEYIEDCQVCCQPIEVSVRFDASGEVDVQVKNENE